MKISRAIIITSWYRVWGLLGVQELELELCNTRLETLLLSSIAVASS
jgi:hypothetical protein